MSERKVLNKYYPPDFDPSKLTKLRRPKERQYTVRLMTPFNMKCNTCGDYIAKAKKFNARKETVMSENYLDLKIFRFYIRCPKCMAEITFKTNPETCDYDMEHGAHRNFDALRLAELQEQSEIEREKEEEKLNPMKLLENRTKQSREEMEELEKLAQLKDENANKQGVDVEELIQKVKEDEEIKSLQEMEEQRLKQEEEQDRQLARQWLSERLTAASDSSSDSDDEEKISKKPRLFGISSGSTFAPKLPKSTELLSKQTESPKNLLKRKLGGVVIVKKKSTQPSASSSSGKTST